MIEILLDRIKNKGKDDWHKVVLDFQPLLKRKYKIKKDRKDVVTWESNFGSVWLTVCGKIVLHIRVNDFPFNCGIKTVSSVAMKDTKYRDPIFVALAVYIMVNNCKNTTGYLFVQKSVQKALEKLNCGEVLSLLGFTENSLGMYTKILHKGRKK